MTSLSLDQLKYKLAIHADEFGEREHVAIQKLLEAFGVSDFLDRVRTEADTLFRNIPLMRTMADWLQQGFDRERLADFDLYIQPKSIPLNQVGSEFFVLFPKSARSYLNHPGDCVGHYYGTGLVCGQQGEMWLHGGMEAQAKGEARLHLSGQSQARCGGTASAELFDQSLVHILDQANVRLHDFSSAFAWTGEGTCRIVADDYSHVCLESGLHEVELSGDVLFMDTTASRFHIADRCSGFKPTGELTRAESASGLVWRDATRYHKMPFFKRIQDRRRAGAELLKPRDYSPLRINQAKEMLTRLGKDSLTESFHRSVEQAQSMTELAAILSARLEDLLERGLRMTEVKRLFTADELRGAGIYTGLEPVPMDLKGKYHVFDHLIVTQTNDQAKGFFHDHAIGLFKAGQAEGDGSALLQGEGNSTVKSLGDATLVLRDQAKGMASDQTECHIMDHAELKAEGYAQVLAFGNAVLNAKGHTTSFLYEDSVGQFSEEARFVAYEHSRYSLTDSVKGVARRHADGSLPISLSGDRQVPEVDELGERAFWGEQMNESIQARKIGLKR